MLTIFKREFKAFFHSPVGFVFLAVFCFFSGLYFYTTLLMQTADLSGVFSGMLIVVLMLIPILTMKLMSDDRRQKTDQALLTAPVGLLSLVFGKYLAAFAVFSIAVSINLVYGLVLTAFAEPEWPVLFGNLTGMLLLGAALIAIGIFISSLTESQVIAAIGTFAASLFILLIDSIAAVIPVDFLSTAISWLSFDDHYTPFSLGVFSLVNVLFFVSIAAIFLFLTVRVLDRRRWN